MTKRITIEKLAGMMKNSFTDLDQKINERLNITDERINKLETRMTKQFFEVHDQLGGLQNQMGNLEKLYTKDREEHKIFRTKIEHLEKTK